MMIHIRPYIPEMIDRLFMSRKEGRRGLNSTEDSIDILIRQLEDYINKNKKVNYSEHKQHKDQQNNNN